MLGWIFGLVGLGGQRLEAGEEAKVRVTRGCRISAPGRHEGTDFVASEGAHKHHGDPAPAVLRFDVSCLFVPGHPSGSGCILIWENERSHWLRGVVERPGSREETLGYISIRPR